MFADTFFFLFRCEVVVGMRLHRSTYAYDAHDTLLFLLTFVWSLDLHTEAGTGIHTHQHSQDMLARHDCTANGLLISSRSAFHQRSGERDQACIVFRTSLRESSCCMPTLNNSVRRLVQRPCRFSADEDVTTACFLVYLPRESAPHHAHSLSPYCKRYVLPMPRDPSPRTECRVDV